MQAPKTAKKKTSFLHPELVYPTEALTNPQLDPDNFPLFKRPADPSKLEVKIFRFTPEAIQKEVVPTFQDVTFQNLRKKPSWETELAKTQREGKFNLMEIWEWDWNGKLLNAHHRANAGIMDLIKFPRKACFAAICAFGLNPENYKNYDYNQKREIWQLLVHKYAQAPYNLFTDEDKRNKSAAKTLGSTTWWLRLYWDAKDLATREGMSKIDRIENWGFEPKTEEITEMAEDAYHGVIAKEKFEAVYNNLQELRQIKTEKKPVASETVFLTLYTLGKEVNPAKAKKFVTALMTGKIDMTDSTDPITVCYKWMDDNRDIPKKRRVYSSLRITVGLACMRVFFDGEFNGVTGGIPEHKNQCAFENDKDYKGLLLGGKRFRGVAGSPRLSPEEDAIFQMEYDRFKEEERKWKDAEASAAAVTEGEAFTARLLAAETTSIEETVLPKTTQKLLTKAGVVTVGDILQYDEPGLNAILTSKAVNDVKDLLGSLKLPLKRR